MTTRTAVIVGGNRTPFAKMGGAYARASSQDLLTSAIDGLVARFGLAGETLGEVAAGAVMRHSPGYQPHPRGCPVVRLGTPDACRGPRTGLRDWLRGGDLHRQ